MYVHIFKYSYFLSNSVLGVKTMAKKKSNKTKASIRIDKDLWELARIVLPCSRSAFMENQLKRYIDSIDEIGELEKEINQLKEELQAKEEKLEHLKEIRKRNDNNKEVMNEAMNIVWDIIQEHDAISQNQIAFISRGHNITEERLINEIKKHNFKIVKYTPEVHETKIKNVNF